LGVSIYNVVKNQSFGNIVLLLLAIALLILWAF
jgi:hypothetical protein